MDIEQAINLINRLNNLDHIYDEKQKMITAFMHEYFSEMLKIEKLEADIYTHNEGKVREDRKSTLAYIKDKELIHNKYWSNFSPYYTPCSSSSEPEHNWEKISEIEIMETGDDDNPQFLFICNYQDATLVRKAFLIKIANSRLSIEHEFFG